MLVLSRRSGERILIGDEIVVTIVRVGPNSVRIGIEAPREMNIAREEVFLSQVRELLKEYDDAEVAQSNLAPV